MSQEGAIVYVRYDLGKIGKRSRKAKEEAGRGGHGKGG